jgi:hypothetical protein
LREKDAWGRTETPDREEFKELWRLGDCGNPGVEGDWAPRRCDEDGLDGGKYSGREPCRFDIFGERDGREVPCSGVEGEDGDQQVEEEEEERQNVEERKTKERAWRPSTDQS